MAGDAPGPDDDKNKLVRELVVNPLRRLFEPQVARFSVRSHRWNLRISTRVLPAFA